MTNGEMIKLLDKEKHGKSIILLLKQIKELLEKLDEDDEYRNTMPQLIRHIRNKENELDIITNNIQLTCPHDYKHDGFTYTGSYSRYICTKCGQTNWFKNKGIDIPVGYKSV